jgi:hypothetical protein
MSNGPSWWNTDYKKRIQLIAEAAAGSDVPAGYSLEYNPTGEDAAKILGDCLINGDDLRVLYWDGSSWAELGRRLVTFIPSETKLRFAAQGDIAGGESDNGYYLYYRNLDAGTPPEDVPQYNAFFDGFDRDDSNVVGNDWVESYHGNDRGTEDHADDVKVESNALHMNRGSICQREAIETSGIIIGGRFLIEESRPLYITTKLPGSGAVYYGKGLGMMVTTGQVDIRDDGAQRASQSISLSLNTWYSFELKVFSDYRMEARVWENSYPSNPTVQCGAFTPSASGPDTGVSKDGGTYGKFSRVEDFYERKLVETDPTFTEGTEEQQEEEALSWWDNDYAHRIKLIVSPAYNRDLYSGYVLRLNLTGGDAAEIFDHALANGNDVRVVYWDGYAWRELYRDLETFTVSEIKALFAARMHVFQGDSDGGYYLYYGNPSPGSLPTDDNVGYVFQDEFDRADGNDVGNSWVESGHGQDRGTEHRDDQNRIASQTLQVSQNGVTQRTVSQASGVTLTGKFSLSEDRALYVTAKRADSGYASWCQGLGMRVDTDSVAITDSNQTQLAHKSMSISLDTWYNYEIRVFRDNKVEVRVWNDGRPAEPTVEYGPFVADSDGPDVGVGHDGGSTSAWHGIDDFEVRYLRDTEATVRLERQWEDTAWNKHQQLTIAAAEGNGIVSGYSLKYNPTGGDAAEIYNDCLANGDDLRVAYWNGSLWIELDRDLVTFSDTEIEVWFAAQADIPGGESDDNYYLYYDNPSAGSPPADKGNVYYFFDDASTGIFSDKWDVLDGTWAYDGGLIKQTEEGKAYRKAVAKITPLSNYVLKVEMKGLTDTKGSELGIYVGDNNSDLYWVMHRHGASDPTHLRKTTTGLGDGTSLDFIDWRISAGVWATWEFSNIDGDIEVLVDGDLKLQATDTDLPVGGIMLISYASQVHWDNVLVRRLVPTEPTVSGGSEEDTSTSAGPYSFIM